MNIRILILISLNWRSAIYQIRPPSYSVCRWLSLSNIDHLLLHPRSWAVHGKKPYVVQKLINAHLDQNVNCRKKVTGMDYTLRMTPQKICTGLMDSANTIKKAYTPPTAEAAHTTRYVSKAAAKSPTPSNINKGPTPFTPGQKQGPKQVHKPAVNPYTSSTPLASVISPLLPSPVNTKRRKTNATNTSDGSPFQSTSQKAARPVSLPLPSKDKDSPFTLPSSQDQGCRIMCGGREYRNARK